MHNSKHWGIAQGWVWELSNRPERSKYTHLRWNNWQYILVFIVSSTYMKRKHSRVVRARSRSRTNCVQIKLQLLLSIILTPSVENSGPHFFLLPLPPELQSPSLQLSKGSAHIPLPLKTVPGRRFGWPQILYCLLPLSQGVQSCIILFSMFWKQ